MNGLIHHFFPKKMIFKFITRIDIEFAMHRLNRRPLNTRYPEALRICGKHAFYSSMVQATVHGPARWIPVFP